MRFNVYAIRDIHTGFMTPTVDQNDQSAIRNFRHGVMQSASLMNSHPEHFSLCRIGEYDTETAELVPCLPVHLADATEVFSHA